MRLAAAVSMGIGPMVGAGVFALLGQAGQIAQNAVWISFLLAGLIALLCGYSLAKLGVRYRSAGGVVEYLVQGFGPGTVSAGISMLFLFCQLVTMALVAKAFGHYASGLFFGDDNLDFWVNAFASVLVIGLTAVHFVGTRAVGRIETVVVVIKLLILTLFAAIGLFTIQPQLLSPSDYPPAPDILAAVAITFFAFAGFQVINNTVEDMPHPAKTLPRAIYLAILLVLVLYLAIAFAAFGNLSVADLIAAKDIALAEAAKPVLGQPGFTIMAIAALLATGSNINANLYGTVNMAYLLAKNGELPRRVDHRVWRQGTEGLVITATAVLVMCNLMDLGTIAGLGSATTLIVYFLVNLGHLRLTRQTEASFYLVLCGVLATLGTTAVFLVYAWNTQRVTIWLLGSSIALCFGLEIVVQRARGRKIQPRCS